MGMFIVFHRRPKVNAREYIAVNGGKIDIEALGISSQWHSWLDVVTRWTAYHAASEQENQAIIPKRFHRF